jgi:hypothetical protein
MEEVKEQIISLPRLGEPAPAFEAVTTHGVLKLEDFKGTWLILFSHPADFTPVCTTEFIAALKSGLGSPEEIAKDTGLPLFRVRSGLRELTQAGLANQNNDKYEIIEKGDALIG